MIRNQIITSGSDQYPAALAQALGKKAPKQMQCLGNVGLLYSQAIGFSGSRKAGNSGRAVAAAYAGQFARKDWTVTSGYASGIDLVAHRAALAAGGNTVVVLPYGMEHFKMRTELVDVWDWNRALVVSQFEPTAPFQAYRAIHRNAVIAGLSKALLVFEASAAGGTMNTGLTTLALGIPLFTPVYPEMPETATGNQLLSEKGARKLEWGARSVPDQIGWVQKLVAPELEMATGR
jgi:DNA processing protein